MRQFLTLVLALLAGASAGAETPANNTPPIRPAFMNQAATALSHHASDAPDPKVILVDYGLHSSHPRLFIWDRQSDTVTSFRASHGRGSDPDHDGYLDTFSNQPGSHASPDGAFRIGETYTGQHGISLRLDGLSAANANARERAIVIHAADYAEPEFLEAHGKLGRSHGCIVLSETDLRRLRTLAKPGTFVFIGK